MSAQQRVRGNEVVHHVAQTNFTIDSRFSELKAVGKGSYGVVVSCMDSLLERKVAIKKITPMAKHTIDAKHILREVRIMRHMGRHVNVVTLEDLMVRETADELYIVMELLDSDLHRVLQSKQALSENHFRHFLFQILCGLKHLHDNRIIHRDLKPGNLLVTRDCQLRITDFGLARERPSGRGPDPDDEIDEPMTEHVVTRWYRPPELMLCPDGMYDYAVDLWSVGCIFAEMLGRKPLFPGKNFVHQLSLIFDVIGSPSVTQVSHIKNAQAKKFLGGQAGKPSADLAAIYPEASGEAIDMLNQLLLFQPTERVDVNEALMAPFLDEVDIEDNPSLEFPERDERLPMEFDFETDGSSKFVLKQLIVDEARSLRKEKGIVGSRPTVALNPSSAERERRTQGQQQVSRERSASRERLGVARARPSSASAANQGVGARGSRGTAGSTGSRAAVGRSEAPAAAITKPRPLSATATAAAAINKTAPSRQLPERSMSANATSRQARAATTTTSTANVRAKGAVNVNPAESNAGKTALVRKPTKAADRGGSETDRALAQARAWLAAANEGADSATVATGNTGNSGNSDPSAHTHSYARGTHSTNGINGVDTRRTAMKKLDSGSAVAMAVLSPGRAAKSNTNTVQRGSGLTRRMDHPSSINGLRKPGSSSGLQTNTSTATSAARDRDKKTSTVAQSPKFSTMSRRSRAMGAPPAADRVIGDAGFRY